MAQEQPPAQGADFQQITTSQFWTRLSDDSIWQYRGVTLGWIRLRRHSEGSGRMYNKIPVGLLNGSNRVFDLASTPVETTVQVFVNGRLQDEGENNDYTIVGAQITLVPGFLLDAANGDKILVSYDI